MESQPDLGAVERLVLATLGPGCSTTHAVAEQLGHSTETVDAAVSRLAQVGLVETADHRVTLTSKGRQAAAGVRRSWPVTTPDERAASVIDVEEVARSVGAAWSARRARHVAGVEATRATLLASDDERDTVMQLLAEAFSQGRLSSSEFHQRADRALAARTHGELDGVLQGLGGLRRPASSHPVRRALFWVVAVLSSPFLLFGGLLLAGGSDADDRIAGIVFLILLLPGLLALRRWAWPRL